MPSNNNENDSQFYTYLTDLQVIVQMNVLGE
ncbi:hypothetical protein NSMM_400191 [Nitrosomonas mobilis]|uniref:Uncharacterized protein n=1 Tax=Nitrosomonas mobilis TaxID=51642 RepID=A0A1G5SET3_9PROT|nr:hypothetical protein NSMM_400191 [Nitrosomonas mobilis]